MTIFSKIIKGDVPCYKIAEDENNFAFLDIYPLVKGHTLVVPKTETDKLFDLPADAYLSLFSFARRVALAIQKSIPCNRVSVHVIGLEVPHAHIHLIPIHSMDDCNFHRPKLQLSKEEFEKIARHIQSNFL